MQIPAWVTRQSVFSLSIRMYVPHVRMSPRGTRALLKYARQVTARC